MAYALKRAAALAVVALIVSACSKVGSQAGLSASVAEPGVVRIVGIGSIDSLVPELSGNASAGDMAMFWGAWLFRVGARGELVPELATEIPTQRNGGISADGLTITYHLRAGVRWQDGAPFDARDVIFSWHVMMNPRNNVLTRSGWDDIVSMTSPDPLTVIVKLQKPYAPAVATFFGPSLAPACLLPEHLLAKLPDINRAEYDLKPIGTGPFVVEGYQSQSALVLRANPNYWRGRPKVDEVRFQIVPDPTTRALMLRTGETDVYMQPADNLVADLHTIPGVHVLDETFNEVWYLQFNLRRAPLDDVRVRRAISMSVDRDYVVRTIAHGGGTPANGDQPPFSWAFDPSAKAPAFDPAGAGRLLDEAGWRVGPDGYRYRNGSRLAFTYVTSSGYGEGKLFAPIFQQEMKRVGIDAALKMYPTSVLFAAKGNGGIVNNGEFDVLWTGWIGGVDPDEDTLWDCSQQPPAGFNFSGLCDSTIDALERTALASYDQSVRRRAYWAIQERLDEQVPADFLFWTHLHDAVSDRLQHYRPAPSVTSFSNPWEWSI